MKSKTSLWTGLTTLAFSWLLPAIAHGLESAVLPLAPADVSEERIAPVDASRVDPIEDLIGTSLHIADREANLGNPLWFAEAAIPAALHDDARVLLDIEIDPKILATPIDKLLAQFAGELYGIESPERFNAHVPAKLIAKLAHHPGVRQVRLPRRHTLALSSEGRQATNANWWQDVGHIRGDGIRIAIIDCFDTAVLARQRAAGEAPPADPVNGTTPQAVVNGRSVLFAPPRACVDMHGNGMLEVLYDMAPQAQFLLINMGEPMTHLDMRVAMATAIAQRADVINLAVTDSLDDYGDSVTRNIESDSGYFDQAYDRGIFAVVAAGNEALSHWAGGFRTLSAASESAMDWNYNDLATPPGRIVSDGGNRSVAILKPASDLVNACTPDGEEIALGLGISRELPYVNRFRIQIMRQQQDSSWAVVWQSAFERPDYAMNLIYSANSRARAIDGTVLTPSANCPANQARYGVRLVRQLTPSFLNLPTTEFLNFFVDSAHDLEFPVSQASLQGSATSPKIFSVGAARACLPASSSCTPLRMATSSSQGPVLGPLGARPTLLNPSDLHWVTQLGLADAVKPDAAVFDGATPSFLDHPVFGTSTATAYASGMAALLMQRYAFLRNNPLELKQVMNTLASQRYNEDADLIRAGYPVGTYAYTYGRGLLRYRKEAMWGTRGVVEHTSVGRLLMTSPLQTRPGAARVPHNDVYGDEVHVRFLDQYGKPVLFPVLLPGARIINGPQQDRDGSALAYIGHRPSDAQFLFEYPPVTAGPQAFEMGLGHWTGGYFRFHNLGITAIPNTNVRAGEALGYSLLFEAYRLNGSRASNAPLTGGAVSGSFNVCTEDAIRQNRNPTQCPAR